MPVCVPVPVPEFYGKPIMNTQFSLALVTGASSGIGLALCHLLANNGIDLIISGRNEAQLTLLANELKNKVKVITCVGDLLVPAERQQVIDTIHTHAPDLVINNAGFGLYGEILTYDTQSQLDILNINATVLLELSIEAARTLISRKKPGVIMNVASVAALSVFPNSAVYASAKAFVLQFSQAFDYEVEPHGVRVLVCCPGMVETNFSQRAAGKNVEPDRSLVMTAEFAAQEIWWQIQQRKKCHIFNWKYRLAISLSHFIPQKWLASLLAKRIAQRLPPRPLKLD